MYPISYNPVNLTESAAILNITNPFTNDIHEYTLKGIVREPVAQDHLIIKCVIIKIYFFNF